MSKQITPSLGTEGIISIFFGVVSVILTGNIFWHGFTILGAGMILPAFFTHKLKNYYEYKPREYNHYEIPIGHSTDGFITFTFGDNTPHLLVAGATGNGKTTFLRSLITTLILNHQNKVKLWLIDLKRIEFPIFERVSIVEQVGYTEEIVIFIGSPASFINLSTSKPIFFKS